MLTLSCHNIELKTAIGNRGFLMYKKYRYVYNHVSNSIRNILKLFAAFEKGSFSAIKFVKTNTTFHIIFHDVKNCQ